MKQTIIMIGILVALFLFGLLIYDFSDELESSTVFHDWYALDDSRMTVLSFKDNKFSYYIKENNEKINEYQSCTDFRYNRSINVIKLKCDAKGNKLYISQITDNELILTIAGEEKIFYASEQLVAEAEFIKDNNITKKEFADLMNIDFSVFTMSNDSEIINLYKSKETKLIAFISENNTIQNALNIKALYNLSVNSNKPLVVIDYQKLEQSELTKLTKYNKKLPKKIGDFDENKISLYLVGNKKFELFKDIKIFTFNEIDSYNEIAKNV